MHIKGRLLRSSSDSIQLHPFLSWEVLLKERIAPRGSKFFPLRAVPYGMENHFFHIRWTYLNVTNIFMHVRNCVMGATPMHTAEISKQQSVSTVSCSHYSWYTTATPTALLYQIKVSNIKGYIETSSHKEINAGPRSAVGNVSGYRCVSDCRSRGREFNPGPVPYFHGDWSWNDFYDHSPPFRWFIQEGLLSVTSESMCTNYWLFAC